MRIMGPVVALVLVAVAGYLWIMGPDRSPSPEQSPPASSSAPHTHEEPTTREIASINRMVKAFTRQYYTRTPERDAEAIKRAIMPYTAPYFIQHATFGYGTAQADMQMQEEGATLRIGKVSDIEGMFVDERTFVGTVTVGKTKLNRQGQIVIRFKDVEELTIVNTGNDWLIYDATP
jgi:hypothetical protein